MSSPANCSHNINLTKKYDDDIMDDILAGLAVGLSDVKPTEKHAVKLHVSSQAPSPGWFDRWLRRPTLDCHASVKPFAAVPPASHDCFTGHVQHENLEGDMIMDTTPQRYAAYSSRLAALMRYAAYTSDFGEAFRPVAHPWLVTGSYAVSWAYVLGDVAWEGRKDYNNGIHGNVLYQHIVKRATFQAVASMALPAFTIHSVVHMMQHHVFKNSSAKLKAIGPSGCGLMCIPFLPLYDHPVEHATEWLFERIWPVGEQGVPATC